MRGLACEGVEWNLEKTVALGTSPTLDVSSMAYGALHTRPGEPQHREPQHREPQQRPRFVPDPIRLERMVRQVCG